MSENQPLSKSIFPLRSVWKFKDSENGREVTIVRTGGSLTSAFIEFVGETEDDVQSHHPTNFVSLYERKEPLFVGKPAFPTEKASVVIQFEHEPQRNHVVMYLTSKYPELSFAMSFSYAVSPDLTFHFVPDRDDALSHVLSGSHSEGWGIQRGKLVRFAQSKNKKKLLTTAFKKDVEAGIAEYVNLVPMPPPPPIPMPPPAAPPGLSPPSAYGPMTPGWPVATMPPQPLEVGQEKLQEHQAALYSHNASIDRLRADLTESIARRRRLASRVSKLETATDPEQGTRAILALNLPPVTVVKLLKEHLGME